MLSIDKQSRTPIYEQIIYQMEKLILVGSIKAGMLIPSVRSLSIDLSINPNTIQKAYNELERRNITYSVPGVGRFVSKEALNVLNENNGDKLSAIQQSIYELALTGISQEKVDEVVQKAFEQAKIIKEKRGIND